MAISTHASDHIDRLDRGLELMREIRAKRAGIAEYQRAITEHPQHEGFCVKCKDRVNVLTETVAATRQKGVHRHQGPCPNCGTAVSIFKAKEPKAPSA